MSDFLVSYGVKKEDFDKALRSFLVDTNVKQVSKMAQDYEITGVPVVIVNGHYKLSPSTVGSFDHFTKAIDYLVSLERKRLSKK